MTPKEFCNLYSEQYGEPIDNVNQIESHNFTGQELYDFVAAGAQGMKYYPESDANAERIVACVNACAGMVDPAKEIAELRAEISRLKNPPSAPTCDELDYDSRS